MDVGQLLKDLGINLVITVIAYMLVPVYLWASAKKYDISKIKKIITVNALVLFVIFTVIQISNGNTTANVGACFLWSGVGYAFMKKYCLKEEPDTQENTTNSDNEQTITHICLSNDNEQSKEYGNFNTYSKDILLDSNATACPHPTTNSSENKPRPNKQKKKTGLIILISIISVFLVMVVSIVVATIISASNKASTPNNDYIISTNADPSFFEDNNQTTEFFEIPKTNSYIEYDSYYVGVRTITFSDNFTAEYVLGLWKRGEATEDSMKEIMDEYGEEQGGGQLYVIEKGYFVDEVDEWCFDRSRQVGDVEIIENDYGFSLCYFSSVIEK